MNEFKKRERRSYERKIQQIPYLYIIVLHYGMYAHEVVIRPLDNGGVQYVSNRIIPSEDNYEATWHKPRLTEEQWEEMYGEPE